VLYNKEIYVFGGRNNIQPYSRNNDLFALNLDLLEWRRIECKGEIPSPRNGIGMVLGQDVLYVFGGIGDKQAYYNDLFKMNLKGI